MKVFRVGDSVVDWFAEHGAEEVIIRDIDERGQRYYVQPVLEGGLRWIPFDNVDPKHDKGQDVA